MIGSMLSNAIELAADSDNSSGVIASDVAKIWDSFVSIVESGRTEAASRLVEVRQARLLITGGSCRRGLTPVLHSRRVRQCLNLNVRHLQRYTVIKWSVPADMIGTGTWLVSHG